MTREHTGQWKTSLKATRHNDYTNVLAFLAPTRSANLWQEKVGGHFDQVQGTPRYWVSVDFGSLRICPHYKCHHNANLPKAPQIHQAQIISSCVQFFHAITPCGQVTGEREGHGGWTERSWPGHHNPSKSETDGRVARRSKSLPYFLSFRVGIMLVLAQVYVLFSLWKRARRTTAAWDGAI